MAPNSIYLHIPFCRHRCAYCDFNTYAGLDGLIPDYTRALCQEIEYNAASSGERLGVHTVFFGGGTPSLLPVDALIAILGSLNRSFALADDLELTLEANPGTLSLEYLRSLRSLGVNRLSLGMQSADPGELRLLEREHGYQDVVQAVEWARRAGFENLNLDLIFGLPYQSLQSWQHSLRLAVGLQVQHLSLYALTLEHGTPMQHWVSRGLLSEPDPDLAAEMYEWAGEYLETNGYHQYEISNWARRDTAGNILECRHNLQYWRCLPYLGFGAGAHGYAANSRIANVLSPQTYIERMARNDISTYNPNSIAQNLQSSINNHKSAIPPHPSRFTLQLAFPKTPATVQAELIDRHAEMGEVMMMGLRLTAEGVSRAAFLERFGEPLETAYGKQVDHLLASGLLEWGGEAYDILRLTQRGRLLGNRVFVEFV